MTPAHYRITIEEVAEDGTVRYREQRAIPMVGEYREFPMVIALHAENMARNLLDERRDNGVTAVGLLMERIKTRHKFRGGK